MNCIALVVKVASRCNLNCTYCYMYNKGDDTYLKQPKFMSIETIEHLIDKIIIHLNQNETEAFLIVFHGGEPLLWDKELYRYFITNLNNKNKTKTKIAYSIQTNGVLVDSEWIQLFKELDIRFSFSIDTTKESTNLNRIYHNGKGSYDDIIRGYILAKNELESENAPIGLISVIDINTNPIDVYNHYKSIGARVVSLLLPDNTHDTFDKNESGLYGKWFNDLFREWYFDTDKTKPEIWPLKHILSLILGMEKMGNELYGNTNNNTLIIETDGSIEVNDPLRVCRNGFTKNDFSVYKNNINDIYEDNLAKLYYSSHTNTCYTCENCSLYQVCGGGYILNRYSSRNGFDNPSIYCTDIVSIITHIQNIIFNEFPELEFDKINFNEIIEEIRNLNNNSIPKKELEYI